MKKNSSEEFLSMRIMMDFCTIIILQRSAHTSLAHPELHHNYITTSRQSQATREAEISCLIKSRTCCCWDLVCCNGDSQPGYCQGCVSGIL